MKTKRVRDELFEILEVEEQLDENSKLAKWATEYVKDAEFAGVDLEDLIYDINDGEAWYSSLPGTIRLVCDTLPYCPCYGWREAAFLGWQRYDGPRGRGPWWIAEFKWPTEWLGGTMIFRDPWKFDFSDLLVGSKQPIVEFELYTSRKARLSESISRRLADAVLFEMRDSDHIYEEGGVICERKWRSLGVEICQSYVLDDVLEQKSESRLKKDAAGIYWHRGNIPCAERVLRESIADKSRTGRRERI